MYNCHFIPIHLKYWVILKLVNVIIRKFKQINLNISPSILMEKQTVQQTMIRLPLSNYLGILLKFSKFILD